MCFSAVASFASSAMLGVVGAMAIRKTTSWSQVLFAGIPLVFAGQQFAEGCVWLALANPNYAGWENGAVRSFLFVAEVVWPVWAPLALWLLEPDGRRKRQFEALVAMGLWVALYLAYYMAFYPVHAEIRGHHIHYALNFPMAQFWYGGIFYVIPTAVPWFISQVKNMRTLGLVLLGSYFVTLLFFEGYLTSVWCFFAAIISMGVFLIVRAAGLDVAGRARTGGSVPWAGG